MNTSPPLRPQMTVEELAFLDCLRQIDGGAPENTRHPALGQRLIEDLMAERHDGMIRLTAAGIERCRSLQHLWASDIEAQHLAAVIVLP